jgi:acetolactate synthase regulatory subunit
MPYCWRLHKLRAIGI